MVSKNREPSMEQRQREFIEGQESKVPDDKTALQQSWEQPLKSTRMKTTNTTNLQNCSEKEIE